MKAICREVLEQAYLFLDGEGLSEAQRLEVEAHLEDCAPCFEAYGLQREATHLLMRLRGASPCPNELKSRILSIIEHA